eukprot:Gb_25786 [translate_table: standard]
MALNAKYVLTQRKHFSYCFIRGSKDFCI